MSWRIRPGVHCRSTDTAFGEINVHLLQGAQPHIQNVQTLSDLQVVSLEKAFSIQCQYQFVSAGLRSIKAASMNDVTCLHCKIRKYRPLRPNDQPYIQCHEDLLISILLQVDKNKCIKNPPRHPAYPRFDSNSNGFEISLGNSSPLQTLKSGFLLDS